MENRRRWPQPRMRGEAEMKGSQCNNIALTASETALRVRLTPGRVRRLSPSLERVSLPSHLCPLRNATLRVSLGFSLSGRATAAPRNVLPEPRGNAREDHLSLLEIAQEKYGKSRRTASTTKSCRLRFTAASSKCFQARRSRSTSTTATQFWRTSPDVCDGIALRFFQAIASTWKFLLTI